MRTAIDWCPTTSPHRALVAGYDLNFNVDVLPAKIVNHVVDSLILKRNSPTRPFLQLFGYYWIRTPLETADEEAVVLVDQRKSTKLEETSI